MFLPVSFILALFIRAGLELWQGPPLPPDGEHALPLVCLAMALFLMFYAALTAAQGAARRLGRLGGRALRLLLMARPALPLMAYACLLFFGRWDGYVRFQLGVGGWALHEFLILAPYFWLEGLAWLGEHMLAGAPGRAADRLRATWLVAPLMFVTLGLHDLLLHHPLTRAAVQEIPAAGYATLALGLLVTAILFPWWLIRIFPARAVEPADRRDMLADLARRAGVRARGIHRLDTRSRILNAAVVGPLAWTRQVLFTDVLLQSFSPRQVLAVFAHELAHVKRHHLLRLLLFFLVLPALLAILTAPVLPLDTEDAWLTAFVGWLVVLLPAFRALSHRFELEADLWGARLCGSPDDMLASLREVERRFPSRSRRGSLRHPSTVVRVAFLERVAVAPGELAAFFRGTFRIQAWLFLLLGAAICLSVPQVVRHTRAHLPGFLLAAGYPRAAHDAWLALPDPDDPEDQRHRSRDLDHATRGVILLADKPPGPARVDELREQALRRADEALAKLDWMAVLGWYGLARRWGESGEAVGALWQYLDADSRGDRPAMRRAEALLNSLPGLPPEIRKAIPELPRPRGS